MLLLYKADQHSQVLDCITRYLILAYYHPPANLYALSFSAIMFLLAMGLVVLTLLLQLQWHHLKLKIKLQYPAAV